MRAVVDVKDIEELLETRLQFETPNAQEALKFYAKQLVERSWNVEQGATP